MEVYTVSVIFEMYVQGRVVLYK